MLRLLKFVTATPFALIAALAITGCSTTGTIGSSEQLADAVEGSEKLVFGKFRLVRNGEEADIGDGLFGTTAEIHFVNGNGERGIVGKVGKHGEFAWALDPGSYRVTTIGFDNRGERVEAAAKVTFTVPADYSATYVGTITLEASFDSGYYGTNGSVDSLIVSNDCAVDCAKRLEALGLAMDAMTVSVFESGTQVQVARAN